MGKQQGFSQLNLRRLRRSTHAVGWTLQGFAAILLALSGALFFLIPLAADEILFIPGLLTMSGFMGISGTVLVGR